MLLVAGLKPGAFTSTRLDTQPGAGVVAERDFVISNRALARLAAGRADLVDGVDKVSASVSGTPGPPRRRHRPPSSATGSARGSSPLVTDALAAAGVPPQPRVTATVRTKEICDASARRRPQPRLAHRHRASCSSSPALAGLVIGTGQLAPLGRGRRARPVDGPTPDRKISGSATASAFGLSWVVLVVAVLGVVVALLGLAWLAAQVPRTNEARAAAPRGRHASTA